MQQLVCTSGGKCGLDHGFCFSDLLFHWSNEETLMFGLPEIWSDLIVGVVGAVIGWFSKTFMGGKT